MRKLPNLEYLNGLPADREALDDTVEQHDQALAIQREASDNAPNLVQERPGEEES